MPDSVRVFVSHHHSPQEDEFTARLVGHLEAAGADVWVDTERIPSGDFVRKINEGLAGRQWLVLVMTPDALRSPWVQSEVNAALHQVNAGRMLGIIPIMAAACDDRDIPLLWANFHRYNATRDYQPALAGLLRALDLSTSPSDRPASGALPPVPAQPLPPLGPAPTPDGATQAPHLTPMSLYNLGFRGYSVGGVDCVLPPVCPVPDGIFTMGSDKTRDKQAKDNETPQFPVLVEDFAIGQYPVTVAEYACAVRAGAVREPPQVKHPHNFVRRPKVETEDWQTQLSRLDHPVVGVSWPDAVAYTQWLANATGQAWRLPTEAEWEKMARWDGRTGQSLRYPWGDTYDSARCHAYDKHIRDLYISIPVGRYPTGASPCGAQDVAGSVREWTSSLYKPYPYNRLDGREDPDPTKSRVIRGGSTVSDDLLMHVDRAAERSPLQADSPSIGGGFRLALAAVGARSA